jgi:hypothetical protein
LCGFCGQKVWQQRISTKKCRPCTVNIACHVKQSIIVFRSSRKGERVSKTNIESVGQWRLPRRQRILRCRCPGTCETVGQVFKCVWRLCWKKKFCLYVIISIRFFSITICNLLIEVPLYILVHY